MQYLQQKPFSTYGVPQLLVHDNGGNFTAKFTSLVMKTMGIHQIKTASYHPEANGLIERLNGTIKKALKKAGAENTSWDKSVRSLCFDRPHYSTERNGTVPPGPYRAFAMHPFNMPTAAILVHN